MTDAREQVVAYSHRLHEAGYVANHDGNVSLRAGARFWITPTAVSKRAVDARSLALCELSGEAVRSGPGRSGGRPPSEVALHVGAYRAPRSLQAVVHAHPPHATAFALAETALGPIALPEAVVSLGLEVPVLPRYLPKEAQVADAVAKALAHYDAILLAGNGVLTVGPDLETAYLRMELVEHYARIQCIGRSAGLSPVPLRPEENERLLALRKKAGLPIAPAGAGQAATPGIRKIVEEELARVLQGRA